MNQQQRDLQQARDELALILDAVLPDANSGAVLQLRCAIERLIEASRAAETQTVGQEDK